MTPYAQHLAELSHSNDAVHVHCDVCNERYYIFNLHDGARCWNCWENMMDNENDF